ncbi:hypothetical protein PAPYR_10716 [Paratrimastix pyriformis]|uniref:Uncharacterized protein n=1 Tax=Paratrimastix pyriformis TaxID=342808 RepID=A0ABQ8U9J4_9EUKA|nr:hypothetical protein PAPYR_10716 [Paratrimastix pyriformis]
MRSVAYRAAVSSSLLIRPEQHAHCLHAGATALLMPPNFDGHPAARPLPHHIPAVPAGQLTVHLPCWCRRARHWASEASCCTEPTQPITQPDQPPPSPVSPPRPPAP